MKTFVSLLFVLLFGLSVFGQNQTVTTSDGKTVILKPDKTWEYVVAPTIKSDSSADTGNIQPDDIKQIALFANQHQSDINKSEFETENEYENRLQTFLTSAQFNNKSANQILVVVKPHFSYDAEAKTYRTTLFAEKADNGTQIQIKKLSYGSFTGQFSYLNFEVQPEKAREISNHLAVAVYGFPIKYNTILKWLEFIPLTYKIFNDQTGEIYSTQSLNFNGDANPSDSDDKSSGSGTQSPTNSGGDVQVRGYTRKDGTYVRPYTRSRPH